MSSNEERIELIKQKQIQEFGFSLVGLDRSKLIQSQRKLGKMFNEIQEMYLMTLPEPLRLKLEANMKLFEDSLSTVEASLNDAIINTDRLLEESNRRVAPGIVS